jgi:hypothetical protein
MLQIVKLRNAGILLATMCLGAFANADTLQLYNTGVNGSGTVLPDGTVGDLHYTLFSVPSGSSQTLVRTSAGGYPIPPYLADDTLSAWIGPDNAQNLTSPAGQYIYRTSFTLPSDFTSASISGGWTSDNDGVKILLNGVDTGNPATSFTQFTLGFAPFSVSSGFHAGPNTLDFVINNGGPGDNPSALRVEMTGTFQTPLPAVVPGVLALFGVSGASYMVRRKRTA